MNDQPDISKDSSPIDLTIPGIDIKYQIPLDDGSGRVLVFGTVVPQHYDDGSINDVVDKLSRAGERQKSLAVLPTVRNRLEEAKAGLEAERNQLLMAVSEKDAAQQLWKNQREERGQRSSRLNPGEVQVLSKIELRIKQHESNIKVFEKQISSESGLVALYEKRLGKEA